MALLIFFGVILALLLIPLICSKIKEAIVAPVREDYQRKLDRAEQTAEHNVKRKSKATEERIK